VKGHFDDHGHPILQKFNTRVRQYLGGGDQPALAAAHATLSDEAAD